MKNIRLGTLVACMCVLWGVRETQCEYCDAAGGVEPGAVCRRTFEEKRWKMRGIRLLCCRILPVWIKMRYASVWNRLLIQPD